MAVDSGVHYPRWFWPSFATPGILWLLLFFVVPLYTVLSVAFGTVDPIFRSPLPVYQPWWWTTSHVAEGLGKATGLFRHVYVRTFIYVFIASAICLSSAMPSPTTSPVTPGGGKLCSWSC